MIEDLRIEAMRAPANFISLLKTEWTNLMIDAERTGTHGGECLFRQKMLAALREFEQKLEPHVHDGGFYLTEDLKQDLSEAFREIGEEFASTDETKSEDRDNRTIQELASCLAGAVNIFSSTRELQTATAGGDFSFLSILDGWEEEGINIYTLVRNSPNAVLTNYNPDDVQKKRIKTLLEQADAGILKFPTTDILTLAAEITKQYMDQQNAARQRINETTAAAAGEQARTAITDKN